MFSITASVYASFGQPHAEVDFQISCSEKGRAEGIGEGACVSDCPAPFWRIRRIRSINTLPSVCEPGDLVIANSRRAGIPSEASARLSAFSRSLTSFDAGTHEAPCGAMAPARPCLPSLTLGPLPLHHSRHEPGALIAPARICARGRASNPGSLPRPQTRRLRLDSSLDSLLVANQLSRGPDDGKSAFD